VAYEGKGSGVEYVSGDERLLDDVRELWEQLNQHHLRLSPNFKDYYRNLRFEKRKLAILLDADGGAVRVDLAQDTATGQRVGYCVTIVDKRGRGLIESIFVQADHRGKGIGGTLLQKALAWMEANDAKQRSVSVVAGNEQAFGFYFRYGFLPRRTVLELKDKKTEQ